MPKLFGKEVPGIIIVGLAAVTVVAAYTALVPAEAPKASTTPRRLSAKVSAKPVAYDARDYSLKFATYTEPAKNAFKPLIVRKDSSALPAKPGEFVADGVAWVYSGRVVVNGVAQGLLENRANGDAEFVEKGQRWRGMTVIDVSSDSITIAGTQGMSITINAGEASEPVANPNVTALPGVAPVNVPPGMMGQIGNNMSVQPTGDPNQNNNNNGRPGRRRGWNNWNNQGF